MDAISRPEDFVLYWNNAKAFILKLIDDTHETKFLDGKFTGICSTSDTCH